MTRPERVLAGLAWLFGLSLIAAACGRGDLPSGSGPAQDAQSSATTGQVVAIDFRSEPDPPRAGDNALEVTVTQPDGSPVTDATVTTVFSMPAMPSMNMPAMRSETTLAHEGAGRYRGTGELTMGGTWNVAITVSRGPEELGRQNFSVIVN